MAVLTSEEKTRLETELATCEAQLTALQTSITNAMTKADVEEYRFDSGVGSQRVKNREIKELLMSQDWLERRCEQIRQRLAGKGVVNSNMRRKVGYYYGN
jgi:hypothetical protein